MLRQCFALAAIVLFAGDLQAQGMRFGGTYIGAMVASDGIVVAADSRSTFIDENGKPHGFIDGMPKIFVQDGPAFALSGLTSVDGELFDTFMRRTDFLLSRPVDEVLYGLSLRLPVRNSSAVFLISAGYVDGVPTICAKNPTGSQICRNSGYIVNRESPSLGGRVSALRAIPTTAQAAAILKATIGEVAASDASVGGPVSLLRISPTGRPQWLENPPRDSGWTTICDIVRDYRAGRAHIVFTVSREDLDRYLTAACSQP